jgi:predicted alpha/beta-fold hydrolase
MEPTLLCVVLYGLGAVWDAVVGVILYVFRHACLHLEETPEVSYVDTERNRAIARAMDRHGTWRRFVPSPWAATSRAQTAFAGLSRRRSKYSRDEHVPTLDGVRLLLEWRDGPDTPEDVPLVVCLYGVAGSGESKVAVDLTDAAFARGWRSVVYNRRGHGRSSLLPAAPDMLGVCQGTSDQGTSDHLGTFKSFPMHADMEDMRAVVRHVRQAFPVAPMVLVGFSVGSNAVVKYLGESGKSGEASPFVGGVSVCNGMDLVKLTKSFTPTGNAFMTGAMRALALAKRPEIDRMAETTGVTIDWATVETTVSARDFETALMLPIYGHLFETLDDYLLANSCHLDLKDVAVPLLCMSALDDPLICRDIPLLALRASLTNPNVFHLATERGGHLGWLTGWRGSSWMMKVLLQFVETLVDPDVTK